MDLTGCFAFLCAVPNSRAFLVLHHNKDFLPVLTEQRKTRDLMKQHFFYLDLFLPLL